LAGTLDDDLGLSGTLDLDASGHAVNDVMRKTKLQLERVTLDLRAETHAHQVEPALEALADARYHIGNQCAHCTRHGFGMAGIVVNSKRRLAVVLTDEDVARQRLCQVTQRALDGNLVGTDRGFDTLRHRYGIFSNTGHMILLMPRSTVLRRPRHWRAPC